MLMADERTPKDLGDSYWHLLLAYVLVNCSQLSLPGVSIHPINLVPYYQHSDTHIKFLSDVENNRVFGFEQIAVRGNDRTLRLPHIIFLLQQK